jgi:hypothetical protein
MPPDPGRNGERDFHGERRTNDTHASTTDPDARLARKSRGKEAKLSFMGHALMENRNGLIVGAVATRASGHAERLAAIAEALAGHRADAPAAFPHRYQQWDLIRRRPELTEAKLRPRLRIGRDA